MKHFTSQNFTKRVNSCKMGIFSGDDDTRVQNINNKILEEETEGLLPDKLSDIKDSMSSIWKNSSSIWSQALEDPDSFVRQLSDSDKDKSKDVWESLVVNASDAVGSLFDVIGLPGGYGNPKRIRHLMDDPFTAEEVVKQGITGLYNYRTPTEAQFSECQKVGGLSAWNTKGWWRCLFPEAVVTENLKNRKDELKYILTKEKVENDRDHSLGLFFPDYTGYMNWRLHMNQLVSQKKIEEEKAQAKSDKEESEAVILTPEDLMYESSLSKDTQKDKNVLGTSQFVTFNYTPEGQEETKKIKTYYDNGTVLVKSEKKITPKDGTAPKIEATERLIDAKIDRD